MKNIIFITLIFISILLSKNLFPYRLNEKLSITHETSSIKNLNQIHRKQSRLYKNPVIAFGSSLLIPGLGQYYLDGEKYWKRIAVYSLLEIIGAVGILHFSRKAVSAKDNYEDWAQGVLEVLGT